MVWLTVISSGPGEQGYVTAAEENAYLAKAHAAPTAALLDAKGEVGRLYGARTTPHMFVIDKAGALIYDGAIDDRPTTDAADVAGATNYVANALQQAVGGEAGGHRHDATVWVQREVPPAARTDGRSSRCAEWGLRIARFRDASCPTANSHQPVPSSSTQG